MREIMEMCKYCNQEKKILEILRSARELLKNYEKDTQYPELIEISDKYLKPIREWVIEQDKTYPI